MLALLLFFAPSDAVLVAEGVARCAIVVPKRVLDAKAHKDAPAWNSLVPEVTALRLRDSVRDLAAVLGRISGAKVEIVADALPAGDKRLPILVGELATKAYGVPAKKFPFGQGLRLTADEKGIGLGGESDLGASYAVYELLDQLGCRWFMPGPLGEILPSAKTITLKKQDLSTGPHTVFRGLWYTDQDFPRRNRMGGMLLNAGHALENTVPAALRKSNPEIRAVIGGKPHAFRVKWTHPLVAKAISGAILDSLKKNPAQNSFSLSPDDGLGWDQSDDTKFDAGDFDAAVGEMSKTDRLLVLCNRVAETVSAKHPNVKLGMLAYADYTRPPVREKVHPAVVPQIAPITFSRYLPMTDDREPNNKAFRYLVEGWGKKSEATSCYFYCYNLAEVASPNPMITKWGTDIPLMYAKGKCRYWQPETLANFETCLHAHWLGYRMAWNPEQSPKALIDELHERFYGAAGKAMAAYWTFIDNTWVKTPEFSGCGFAHTRRWDPKVMKQARALMDAAKKASATDQEKRRVALADESLALFEQFMAMRWGLAEGRFKELPAQSESYTKQLEALARKHKEDYCFEYVPWGFGGKGGSLSTIYFKDFYEFTHLDAGRIAKDFEILTPTLREWRWKQDEQKVGEKAGWISADAKDWKTTDVMVDSWSALGLHNYMGSVWYRRTVKLPALPKGKKAFLWIGSTDGSVKVFVNGKHVPWTGPKGEKEFNAYCRPASFDLTSFVKAGENEVAIFATRTFMNELGTGGLLAAPVVYREK